jgi:hypothetical protein
VVAILACAAVVVRFGGAGPAVVVVEEGYSVVEDVEGQPMVSFGVVVENRTDEVARLLLVRVAIDDGDDCCRDTYEFVVDSLQPGQRVGVGSTVPAPATGAPRSLRADVEGIDVSVDGPGSTQEAHRVPEQEIARAEHVRVAYSPTNEPEVTFTTASRAGTRWEKAYAIFRDADGAIVGGTGTSARHPGVALADDQPPWALVAEAPLPDLATVEVHLVE